MFFLLLLLNEFNPHCSLGRCKRESSSSGFGTGIILAIVLPICIGVIIGAIYLIYNFKHQNKPKTPTTNKEKDKFKEGDAKLKDMAKKKNKEVDADIPSHASSSISSKKPGKIKKEMEIGNGEN